MGIFQEYINSKGKVNEPVVDASGDQIDPKTSPNKAPKEHGGKEYVAKAFKFGKEKGLADTYTGGKDLVYEPATDGKKGKAPAKIPTAEQASISSLVSDAILRDPSMVKQLVNQFKREGLIAPVIAEMLNYKETFQNIAEVMSHESYGPSVCRRLARAMNEEITTPFHTSLDQNDEDEDEIDDEDEMDQEGFDDESPEMGMDEPDVGDPNMMGDPNEGPDMMEPQQQPTPAMKNLRKAMSRF